MSFDRQYFNAAPEAQGTELNLNSVVGTSGEAHVGKLLPAKGSDRFSESNDAVSVAQDQWHSIMTKFQALPDDYQKMVLASFAEHMTGDQYPAYEKLRASMT